MKVAVADPPLVLTVTLTEPVFEETGTTAEIWLSESTLKVAGAESNDTPTVPWKPAPRNLLYYLVAFLVGYRAGLARLVRVFLLHTSMVVDFVRNIPLLRSRSKTGPR